VPSSSQSCGQSCPNHALVPRPDMRATKDLLKPIMRPIMPNHVSQSRHQGSFKTPCDWLAGQQTTLDTCVCGHPSSRHCIRDGKVLFCLVPRCRCMRWRLPRGSPGDMSQSGIGKLSGPEMTACRPRCGLLSIPTNRCARESRRRISPDRQSGDGRKTAGHGSCERTMSRKSEVTS
jgi:hypothetical protein